MLEPRSATELNRLVEFLQAHPALCIEIEGHTDQIGAADYSYELSTKRTQAIYDNLIASRALMHRIIPIGAMEKADPLPPRTLPLANS